MTLAVLLDPGIPSYFCFPGTLITFLLQAGIHSAPTTPQEVNMVDSVDLNKENPVEWQEGYDH